MPKGTSSRRIRRTRTVLRWVARLLAVGAVVNGVRLRRQLGAIARVEPAGAGADAATTLDDWVFVTASGVTLSDGVKVAVAEHAARHGLDVVDLMPADLPVERALESLRMIDTATFRSNRLHPGRGFFQALAVPPPVADRAQLLGEEQALLDQDPVALAPGGPPHVVGRGRVHHVGGEDRGGRTVNQALGRLEPLGGVVAGRPVVQGHLELVAEMAQRDAAPDEEAIALAFRAAQQLQIEHSSVPYSAACN